MRSRTGAGHEQEEEREEEQEEEQQDDNNDNDDNVDDDDDNDNDDNDNDNTNGWLGLNQWLADQLCMSRFVSSGQPPCAAAAAFSRLFRFFFSDLTSMLWYHTTCRHQRDAQPCVHSTYISSL